jgi:hypothetical protein
MFKRPSFSPTQPRRAKTRLSRARPQQGARYDEQGAACLCALARSTTGRIRRVTCVDAREMVGGPCLREPAVSSRSRRTITPSRPELAEASSWPRGRYVEALSDARTKHGQEVRPTGRSASWRAWGGRVKWHVGWACAFFNILLRFIEMCSAVAEQVIVWIECLIACLVWVDVEHTKTVLIRRRTGQDRATWTDDFALSDIREPLLSPPLFRSYPIGRDAEHAVLQTPRHHGLRAVGQNKIRRMTNDVGAFQCKRPCRFRIKPVKTHHDPDSG